jgi:hypothetical protein
MKLHEIIEVHQEPYFRKMRVEGGFMYNFYDVERDEYRQEWTFVPDASDERVYGVVADINQSHKDLNT